MGYHESGHWVVTTTDDAYGHTEGANFEPERASLEDTIWCVYDARYDDEPIGQGMTNRQARFIATALNVMDHITPLVLPYLDDPELRGACVCGHAEDDHEGQCQVIVSSYVVGSHHEAMCDCEQYRLATLPYTPRRKTDLYSEVEARGYYVVCCKACDSGRVAPVPFANEESRTGWIREHTLGTGHTHYHLVNPTPHQAKIVAVDAPPNILPPGFALAGEVSLGAVTAGPSATDLVEDE